MKEFADDNFKFDENGSNLSKCVENIVGKGEIARYEQFLLFPQCIQKVCFQGASKGVIVWAWVNSSPNVKILPESMLKAYADNKLKLAQMTDCVPDRVGNNVRKEDTVCHQCFLLFSNIVFKRLLF